jgi:hypothetical protein
MTDRAKATLMAELAGGVDDLARMTLGPDPDRVEYITAVKQVLADVELRVLLDSAEGHVHPGAERDCFCPYPESPYPTLGVREPDPPDDFGGPSSDTRWKEGR